MSHPGAVEDRCQGVMGSKDGARLFRVSLSELNAFLKVGKTIP